MGSRGFRASEYVVGRHRDMEGGQEAWSSPLCVSLPFSCSPVLPFIIILYASDSLTENPNVKASKT